MKGAPKPMKMVEYRGNISGGGSKMPMPKKAKGSKPAKGGKKRGCSCGG